MSRWRLPLFYLAAMVALSIGLGFGTGCKKERSGRSSRDRQAQSQNNKGGAQRGASKGGRSKTRSGRSSPGRISLTYPPLESIKLDVPIGWSRYYVKEPPAGLRASFRLSNGGPTADDVLVLLEHVPGIEGREQAMLAGWFGQELKLPRSIPTADEMNLRESKASGITLTIAEMAGARRNIGGSPDAPKPSRHSMIIAILDHPNGPHVIRVGGPSQDIRRWKKSILTYINSARVVR